MRAEAWLHPVGRRANVAQMPPHLDLDYSRSTKQREGSEEGRFHELVPLALADDQALFV